MKDLVKAILTVIFYISTSPGREEAEVADGVYDGIRALDSFLEGGNCFENPI